MERDSESVSAPPKSAPNRDAAVEILENGAARMQKRSPKSATLLKDGLRANLSPSEATAQLRVLCRKFAALTDKVKEETRLREDAQREVRRLKAVIEGNESPVVATCRADSQAFVRELKQAHDALKQELKLEKDKNARLVTRALELEREKNALLANQSELPPPPPPASYKLSPGSQPDGGVARTSWDKEQVHKIQSTLKTTINELQDELTRKQEELETYRERFQRERGRVKALEDDIRVKDESERTAHVARKQLEDELRQAQADITSELENVQRVHERAKDDRAVRDTLEDQLATLNEVNGALEQRCKALVRRLELAAGAGHELDDLKAQLRDAEIDNETLVHTLRNLKEQHFEREKEWKAHLESLRDEKRHSEERYEELENELAAARAQNALLSEWMLVRNENAVLAQREDRRHPDFKSPMPSSTTHWSTSDHRGDDTLQTNRHREDTDDERWHHDEADDALFVHTDPAIENSSRTAKQTWMPHSERGCCSPASIVSGVGDASPTRVVRVHNIRKPEVVGRNLSTASTSSSPCSGEHERLRALMNRNRELQHRLQQETMATQSLEQEITDLTSSYGCSRAATSSGRRDGRG